MGGCPAGWSTRRLQSGGHSPRARPAALKAAPAARKEATNRQKLKSYADLSPGDLVVHEHHGVGRYVGMVKMPADGVEKDYVKIAYAGTDVLYVPATQLDLVSKYIGGGEDAGRQKAAPSWGHRLGAGQDQGQEGGEGPGQGADPALRPAAAAARLRLLSRTPPGSGSLRSSLTTPRRRTSCGASRRSSGTWSALCPWTGFCAATWGTARRRWPSGP
ncbi:MAG: CarD family transcriptional regulator [Flavonifractor plautii]